MCYCYGAIVASAIQPKKECDPAKKSKSIQCVKNSEGVKFINDEEVEIEKESSLEDESSTEDSGSEAARKILNCAMLPPKNEHQALI